MFLSCERAQHRKQYWTYEAKIITKTSTCVIFCSFILFNQICEVTVHFHCVLNTIQKIFPCDGEQKRIKYTVNVYWQQMLGEAQRDCVGVTRENQMYIDVEQKKIKKKIRLDSGKVLLEEIDEPVGGWVVGVDLCGILKLSLDLLCKLFAQFDSDNTQEGAAGWVHLMISVNNQKWSFNLKGKCL